MLVYAATYQRRHYKRRNRCNGTLSLKKETLLMEERQPGDAISGGVKIYFQNNLYL
jgi:hypothetical protein